jgi:hypothetical protein
MATPKDQALLEASLGELLDDSNFHELDRRVGRFNLFEAVGGVRAELRHSNFLAFIFSPTEATGWGPSCWSARFGQSSNRWPPRTARCAHSSWRSTTWTMPLFIMSETTLTC